MGSMPIVAVQPVGKLGRSLVGMLIGERVGPLAQAGLDKSLGFAVGFGRVGLGSDVPETKSLAGPAEGEGFVAGTVVGHDALDLDAETCVVSDGRTEERCRAPLALIGHHLGKSNA